MSCDAPLFLFPVEGTEYPWIAYFPAHPSDSDQNLVCISITIETNTHNITEFDSPAKGVIVIPLPNTNLVLCASITRDMPQYKPANLRMIGKYNVASRYCKTAESDTPYVINMLWKLEATQYGNHRIGYYINTSEVSITKRCKNADTDLPSVGLEMQ